MIHLYLKSRKYAGFACLRWSVTFKMRTIWSNFVASDDGLREAGMINYRYHIQTHYEV